MKILYITIAAVIVASSCSEHEEIKSKLDKENSLNNSPNLSIKQLNDSPLIDVFYHDYETGEDNVIRVVDPSKLSYIKTWIESNAWPPIDQNTLGNVKPIGAIKVFLTSGSDSEYFYVSVYGSKSRADQKYIHVKQEDWNKLLSQVIE